MQDNWIPGLHGTQKKFYDVKLFSSDTVTTSEEYGYIGLMYFRIDTNKMEHERVVYRFSDWLVSIAGIERLLLRLLVFVFGDFAQFNSSIEVINE